jgi:hypothetical protein
MMELTAIVFELLSLFPWRKIYGHRKRLYSSDGRYMIRIKCINPKCTAPDGIFEFDDSKIGAAGPSGPEAPSAMRYVIDCPYCGTKNMVWLKRPSASYRMSAIIVKDEPQDFR